MAGLLETLGNPYFGDIATGLLANSGWTTTPTTFGQAIGNATQFANSRQGARLELDAARQKLEQDKARQEAMGKFQSLLQPTMTPAPVQVPGPAPITTPQGKQEAFGLLAQIAPEQVAAQFASGLLSQPEAPRLSTDAQTYAAISGITPDDPRFMPGFLDYQRQVAQATADPTATLQAQVELQGAQLELQNALDERDARNQEQIKNSRRLTANTNQNLSALEAMATNLEKLEGTVLQSGIPLPEFRRGATGFANMVQQFVGSDNTKMAALNQAFDSFSKEVNKFNISSAADFSSNALTNSKLALIQNAFANMQVAPGTGKAIIGETIKDLITAADIDGIEVANRDRLETLANRLTTPNNVQLPSLPETADAVKRPSMSEADIDAETRRLIEQLKASGFNSLDDILGTP